MNDLTIKSTSSLESSEEFLKINKNHGAIHGQVQKIFYRDKDTRQFVIYIPSLGITGYGGTIKKADEMVKFSINDFFGYLLNLSIKNMEEELQELGWKKNQIHHKEYSKTVVSIDGELKNFNAVGDNVKVEALNV